MNRMENEGMEHFVTCGEMKLLERRADENGLSYYQMMENAGTQAAKMIRAYCDMAGLKLGETAEAPGCAVIFCGSGNNGGDGFVVARLLAQTGCSVRIVLVNGKPKTEDASTNFNMLQDLPVDIVFMQETEDDMPEQNEAPDLFVDAMFGTGFHGTLKGNALKAAAYMNSCRQKFGTKVFALDIPSGLGGDQLRSAKTPQQTVRADCTITFHARKPVHVRKFAAEYCGRILVADIGIDEEKLMRVEI